MWKSFKVIDADAHMHEPQDMWERYVSPSTGPGSQSGVHERHLHG